MTNLKDVSGLINSTPELFRGTEENHDELQSVYPVLQPSFEGVSPKCYRWTIALNSDYYYIVEYDAV